jgi:phosphoribosylanthranilate isomerase
MTSVKICGLTEERSVAAAVEAGADWIGFVFHPTSPRAVSPERAARLAAPARGRARVVAVVVDADDALVSAIATKLAPDAVQLHGREQDRRLLGLRALFRSAQMWKALPVASREDLTAADAFTNADQLLLDAKPPKDADRTGGHGRAFDWSLLQGWRAPKPWILSGGLTPEGVSDAIRVTGANAVDVSSGVESAPGVKDPAKIAAFIAAAKAARASGAAA